MSRTKITAGIHNEIVVGGDLSVPKECFGRFGQEIAPNECIPSGTADVITDRIRQVPCSLPPLADTIRRW